MADFKRANTAPQPDAAVSASPEDQGGAPVTGFSQAPVGADEQGNFGVGEAIPPSRRVIH